MTITKKWIDFLKRDFTRGFIAYCGLEALEIGNGKFESFVALKEHHLQQNGFVHAGLIAAMADHTAGYAAFTAVSPDIKILTIEFKINYLKPATGESLICRSRVINRGKRIIIAESEVFAKKDGMEKMISKALVTLMAVPKSDLEQRPVKSPS